MKKFRFKFDTVLHLRKSKEDEALRALGSCQAKYQEQLQIKKFYLAEIDKTFAQKDALSNLTVGVSQFQAVQEYIEGTKQRVVFTDQAILRASRAVQKAMWIYFSAKKQRRILESLYEKQYQQYRETLKKHELRMQDDLTVMRFRPKGDEL